MLRSVIIPFRYGGGDSLELRICLRSIDKFVPDVQDVYLIGNDRPAWFFGINIPWEEDKRLTPVCKVMHKLRAACHDPRVTEDMVYFNDDFFLLQPLKDGPFFMRNSPLRNDGGIHHKGFQLAFDELDRRGIPKPYYDAELHHPCIYNKAKVLKLMGEINIDIPYAFRTLYANLLRVQLAPETDHKRPQWIPPKPNDYCVSTSDNTIGQDFFIKWYKATFPDKSRWEL